MTADQKLVQRLRAGDQAALSLIYERFKDDLLTVATWLVVDTATGEDVLHDTFVAFASRASQLRLRTSLRSYLVACVANRARDELRRRSRRPASLGDTDDSESPAAGPAQIAADCEQADRLLAALASLPYEQRETIVLQLHGDLTFAEIARQQDLSISTVQSRYRYGLDKLRSLLVTGVRA